MKNSGEIEISLKQFESKLGKSMLIIDGVTLDIIFNNQKLEQLFFDPKRGAPAV
jgi:hypothetical protein